jgi:hypothetical protein
MNQQQEQSNDDFDLEYSGTDNQREVTDGTYTVAVKSVKKTVLKSGNFAGENQLEWRMTIQGGTLNKAEFVMTSMLGPEKLLWTTDRIIKAIFPAIQKGQKPTISEMVGKKLEVAIKTRVNQKNGKTSMYVETVACNPHIEGGAAGNLGDMA